jgi:TrmH family RNA methyltransferase
MKNELISSRQNPLVKELQAIAEDRNSRFMILEGPRLVEEVLKSPLSVDILVWTTAAEADPVVSLVQPKAKRLCRVSSAVFEALSDVKSPQGILAVVERPRWTWDDLLKKKSSPLVILDGLQDPGNMATILRTAEAADASGVVTTPGTVRLFSPKALRGAMGSTLRLPILEHLEIQAIVGPLQKAGYTLIGTAAGALSAIPTSSYTALDWSKPCAIVLGNEGQGLSKAWSSHLAINVQIPMQVSVESLNVSAAAALLLYESYRHRI